MKNKKVLLACLSLVALTLTACDKPKASDSVTETPTETPTVTPSETPVTESITAVKFENFKDLELNRGDSYSIKKDIKVTATTDSGNSISLLSILSAKQDGVALTNNFNTQAVGTYDVVYTVDPNGLEGYTFATGIELTKTIILTVNEIVVTADELIKNGDFSEGQTGWGTFSDNVNCTFDFSEGYMKCVQTTIGAAHEPRLNTTYPNTGYQFTLQQGVSYNVSLRLKADAARNVQVQLGTLFPSSPWWGVLEDTDGNQLLHEFDITTEWAVYSWQFTLASSTSENTHITLEMGTIGTSNKSIATTIYADDISVRAMEDDGSDKIAPTFAGIEDKRIALVESSTETVDVLAGVTATDAVDGDVTTSITYTIENAANETVTSISKGVEGTYTVTYTVKDAANNERTATATIIVTSAQIVGTDYANPTKVVYGNGGSGGEDFCKTAKDSSSWYYWYAEGDWGAGPIVSPTVTMNESGLTIDATLAADNTAWASQLFYSTATLDAGKYDVSFSINSNVARKIVLNGTTYDLIAGDNTITLTIDQAVVGAITFALQLGVGSGAEALTVAGRTVLTFDLDVIYRGN